MQFSLFKKVQTKWEGERKYINVSVYYLCETCIFTEDILAKIVYIYHEKSWLWNEREKESNLTFATLWRALHLLRLLLYSLLLVIYCGGVCVIAVFPVAGTLYGWVPCLCGAPDVPHAGHESQVGTSVLT